VPGESEKYLPLDPGNSWTYVDLENGDFEEVVLAKKVRLDDKEYIQSNRQYTDGRVDVILRRFDQGHLMYYDDESKIESLEIPRVPRKEFSWVTNDDWYFIKIIKVGATLKTPAGTYSDCTTLLDVVGKYISISDSNTLNDFRVEEKSRQHFAIHTEKMDSK
jgi:hypothetical protein